MASASGSGTCFAARATMHSRSRAIARRYGVASRLTAEKHVSEPPSEPRITESHTPNSINLILSAEARSLSAGCREVNRRCLVLDLCLVRCSMMKVASLAIDPLGF